MKLITLLFSLFSFSALWAQNIIIDTVKILDARPINDKIVSQNKLNEGNIAYPLQLLQGRIAGLAITRVGSNPNEDFQLRLRGLKSIYGTTKPLYLLNGVAISDINDIDPQDIDQITVETNLTDRAIYGARAAGALINIQTKKDEERLNIRYNSYVAFESVSKYINNASAAEFRAISGQDFDLGANTNWFDLVTKNALSQAHNLRFSMNQKNTQYGVALNYRNQKGITGKDGFQKLNALAFLRQNLFKEKLKFEWNGLFSNKQSDLGFVEAFRYAVTANPTATVKDVNDLGGYWQPQLFDAFNPVAILDLSYNKEKQNSIVNRLSVSYEMLKGLEATLQYTNEHRNIDTEEYYSKLSRFRGNYVGGNGFIYNNSLNNNYFNAFLKYEKKINKTSLNAKAGYDYFNEGSNLLYQNAQGFANDKFDINLADTVFQTRYTPENTLIGMYADAKININETYFFNLGARREGNNKLGENKKWGIFPWAQASMNIHKFWNGKNPLRLTAGFATMGIAPESNNLSKLTFIASGVTYYNGTYIFSQFNNQIANPDLGFERLQEWHTTLDVGLLSNALNVQLKIFGSQTKDMILPYKYIYPGQPFSGQTQWRNDGKISSKGWEASLNYNIIDKNNLKWFSGINMYASKSKLDELGINLLYADNNDDWYLGYVGAPGNGNLTYSKQFNDATIGNITGYIYEGINPDGSQKIKDINKDSYISEKDLADVGQGLPTMSYGWYNQINIKNFDINILLRGALGHSLANEFRLFYENSSGPSNGVNQVKTENYDANLKYTYFSNRFVEKASFLRIENISLGYTFSKIKSLEKLRIYIASNNLLTITKYTGANPEVRYLDYGPTGNGSRLNNVNVLVMGVDRRNSYLPTSSLVVGLNVRFSK